MFSLLKSSPAKTPSPLTFGDDDLEKIFSSFKFEEVGEPAALIRLNTDKGITTSNHLKRRIIESTAKDDYVSSDDLAQRLRISKDLLHDLRQRYTESLLAGDGIRLRSEAAVHAARATTEARLRTNFVDLKRVIDMQDIHSKESAKLLNGLESVDAEERHLTETGLNGFVATRSVANRFERRLYDDLEEARKDERIAELSASDYPELDGPSLKRWVEIELDKGRSQGKNCCRGRLSQLPRCTTENSAANQVEQLRFIHGDVTKKMVSSLLTPLMRGDELTFDGTNLGNNHDLIPGGFDDVRQALAFIADELCDEHGRRFPVVVRSGIVISQNRLAERIVDHWTHRTEDGFIDLRPIMASYPSDMQGTVREHAISHISPMMDELVQSEGDVDDRCANVHVINMFLYSQPFLQTRILPEIRTRTKKAAEKQWVEDVDVMASNIQLDTPRLFNSDRKPGHQSGNISNTWQNSSEADDFFQQAVQASTKEAQLLQNEIQSVFTQSVESLSEATFASIWRDRLTAKLQLYTAGLESLAAGPLKDQLAELLNDHIKNELFTQSMKRSTEKSRGLANDKTPKRLEKLRLKLKESPSLAETTAYLHKFQENCIVPIVPLSVEELIQKQKAELASLLKIVREDKDPARRFLCAVLTLLATRSRGILYATGKSAPKLLKTLSGTLSDSDYETMEAFKNEAKTGKLKDETVSAVRQIIESALERSDVKE